MSRRPKASDETLIELFLDMLAAERGASENTLAAYRNDLEDLSAHLRASRRAIADAATDDQTIRRCRYFAAREGSSRLDVVNLYAYRARHPRDLVDAHLAGVDVTGGAEADAAIEYLARTAALVIAAWGNRPARLDPVFHAERIEAVRVLAGGSFSCLGVTADGNPRHPSRLPNDAVLSGWRP